MFTGLVEETGQVRSVRRAGSSLHLTVKAEQVLKGMQLGDSVAVNGVCLTVVQCDGETFTADVMPATFERTNLKFLTPGALVNLERALTLGDRLGGHIVQGHVDGTGIIEAMVRDEIAVRMTVKAPPEVLRYLVPKGSVAVDGISLTVVDVGADRFQVSLIPHTVAVTNLARRRPGDVVNLEADILAKYVEHLLSGYQPERQCPDRVGQSGLTEAFLREHGF